MYCKEELVRGSHFNNTYRIHYTMCTITYPVVDYTNMDKIIKLKTTINNGQILFTTKAESTGNNTIELYELTYMQFIHV